jgi:acyl-CoA synthetase (AMP-forming)/AMP-acid ligase II
MFYIPAWVVGATVVMADARGFVAERWLSLVETEKITHCHLVPTMLIRVLDSGAAARFDLSSLQTLGYGSAAMPRERIEELHKTFGSILVQGYGMTEVSSLAAVLTKADHAKALTGDGRQLSACGRAVFGCELRVVDDNGRAVRDGEIGEIVFRSPQVTTGYWRDTERTQAAIQNDWLHSGDLATIDSEGYIYIVDRKSDIIISGGFNVSSKEVEEIIGWHPSVREAAVVARPDQEWGEKVHAFVALRPGAMLTQTELIAFCRDKLAGIKCPDAVEFIDELPRNALGKLIKSELRGWVRAHASANQVKSHA